jgi:hypothetical protein
MNGSVRPSVHGVRLHARRGGYARTMQRTRLRFGGQLAFVLSVALLGLALLLAPAAGAVAPTSSAGCPPATSTPLGTAPQSAPLTEASAPPPPAAEALIACVATTPILGATLAHWTTVAERAAAPPAKASAAATSEVPPADQALRFLLSADWVLGEARTLGIHISEAQVRRSYDRTRTRQFHKRSQFHAFLRSSGETVADLLLRVRLDMASNGIQRHLKLGRGSTKKQQQALARFVLQSRGKWRAQTYCAAAYLVNDCGNSF